MKVLVTGAAGTIGRVLRDGLLGCYPCVRLTDKAAMTPARTGEEVILADLTDTGAVAGLMDGMDAVVHLGAVSGEADWATVLANNITVTWNVFEAARGAGVRRMVFASSNHVVGFHRRDHTIDHTAAHRPDTRYGLSKAFGEDLGRLHADKHGMEVFCMRIGSFQAAPRNVRELSTWLSHGDMVRLVTTGLETPELHFEVVYGISRNTRSWWNNRRAYALGYEPEDDSEAWAETLIGTTPAEPGGDIARRFQGGIFCEREFDGDPEAIS